MPEAGDEQADFPVPTSRYGLLMIFLRSQDLSYQATMEMEPGISIPALFFARSTWTT